MICENCRNTITLYNNEKFCNKCGKAIQCDTKNLAGNNNHFITWFKNVFPFILFLLSAIFAGTYPVIFFSGTIFSILYFPYCEQFYYNNKILKFIVYGYSIGLFFIELMFILV